MMSEILVYVTEANHVDDYTEYCIEVHHGGYSWTVKHRYSEFKEMHDMLRSKHTFIEKNLLPPKKLFGKMDPVFIDKRRQELEAYLQSVLNRKYSHGLPRTLKKFLHFQFYDIEMICQVLAQTLYFEGDRILSSGSSYTFSPLQLWAITERLLQQKPKSDTEDPKYDFGHVLDFVQKLKHLRICCESDCVGTSNINPRELTFDLSIFHSLQQLVSEGCGSSQVEGFLSVRLIIHSLSVHQSLNNLQSILTGGYYNQDEPGLVWTNLHTADFSDNSIYAIDKSAKLLSRVEFLDLSKNKIRVIQNLETLSNLTYLDMSHNLIDSFDLAHTKLGNIKTLNLSNNKLKSLSGLSKLYSLETLNVSHNLIVDLDEVDFVSRLPCISKLDLSENTLALDHDYRTQTLSRFGSRACEITLDDVESSQRELDTAAVLSALLKSRRASRSKWQAGRNLVAGKRTSPIQIKQRMSLDKPVLSAPGRFLPQSIHNTVPTHTSTVSYQDASAIPSMISSDIAHGNATAQVKLTNSLPDKPILSSSTDPVLRQTSLGNQPSGSFMTKYTSASMDGSKSSKSENLVEKVDDFPAKDKVSIPSNWNEFDYGPSIYDLVDSPSPKEDMPTFLDQNHPDITERDVTSDSKPTADSSKLPSTGGMDDTECGVGGKDHGSCGADPPRDVSVKDESLVVFPTLSSSSSSQSSSSALDAGLISKDTGKIQALTLSSEQSSTIGADEESLIEEGCKMVDVEEGCKMVDVDKKTLVGFQAELLKLDLDASSVITSNFKSSHQRRDRTHTAPVKGESDQPSPHHFTRSTSVSLMSDDKETVWNSSLVLADYEPDTTSDTSHEPEVAASVLTSPLINKSDDDDGNTMSSSEEESRSKCFLSHNSLKLVSPVMRLEFFSPRLQHLSMFSPAQLHSYFMAHCSVDTDELLLYITWSDVVFLNQSEVETACLIFLSNRSLYFVFDHRTEVEAPEEHTEDTFCAIKDPSRLSWTKISFIQTPDLKSSFQIVIGLFGQSVRITGSNQSQTATLVFRSQLLTRQFVQELATTTCHQKSVPSNLMKLLDQSESLVDEQISLASSDVTFLLANEQSMMEFNLASAELHKRTTDSTSVPQLLLYCLVHLVDPDVARQPMTFVITSDSCCLYREDLVSYPLPSFIFTPPPEQRYRDFRVTQFCQISSLRIDDVIGHDVTIESLIEGKMTKWRMEFRDYNERERCISSLCSQYKSVCSKDLPIKVN